MNIEQNTKHAPRATQVEQQVDKRTHTYVTDSGTGKSTSRGFYMEGVMVRWRVREVGADLSW